MSGDGRKIIVIKKKVKAKAGHHGGSWKVAYADFVTAMMAFFLVMWIMGMDAGVKDMVQGYFQNPVGFKKSFSGGRNIMSQGNSMVNADVRNALVMKRREEETLLHDAAEEIRGTLERSGLLDEKTSSVELVVSGEGLRIELMETTRENTFFDQASARLKPELTRILGVVGGRLAGLPEMVVVEGHTDGVSFGRQGYSNWELSVDRANAARRALVAAGLEESRILEVRGHADRQLKIEGDPTDPRNRRISILLPFLGGDPNLIQLGSLQDEILEASGPQGAAGGASR
ncbi:MAG: flagellar motor protein MotB [Longimicrobiales bacterium]